MPERSRPGVVDRWMAAVRDGLRESRELALKGLEGSDRLFAVDLG